MKLQAKKALLSLASVFFAVVLAEGVARLLPRPVVSPLLPFRPHSRIEFVRNMHGRVARGTYTTNKWGLRGDEPPRQWSQCLTILTIGGSTTICDYLDDKKTWSYRMQQLLQERTPVRVWVGNAGLSGQSTFGHLLLMDEMVLRIQPRIAVFLVGVNDLSMLLADDSGECGNTFDRSEAWRSHWKVRLRSRSRLLQQLYPLKRLLWDRDPLSSQVVLCWKPVRIGDAETALPPELLEKGLAGYRANIRSLTAKCRGEGITPVFLTQPILFEETPYWHQYQGVPLWVPHEKRVISAGTLAGLMHAYNVELLNVCKTNGVHALDLESRIPHTMEYFVDMCHLTELGAEKVAKETSAFLQDSVQEFQGSRAEQGI